MPCDGARAPGRPWVFHIFVLFDIHAGGVRAKTRGPALALQAVRSAASCGGVVGQVLRCVSAPLPRADVG